MQKYVIDDNTIITSARKPFLAVDIDGTIAETPERILDTLIEELPKKIREIKDSNALVIYDIKSFVRDLTEKIFAAEEERIYSCCKPVHLASFYLNKIRTQVRLAYVTNRDGRFYDLTRDWLLKNDFPVSNCNFLFTDNKVAAIKQFSRVSFPLIAVEDSPEEILDMAQAGIKVIIFDRPYNRHINPSGSWRARDWREVYLGVMELLSE